MKNILLALIGFLVVSGCQSGQHAEPGKPISYLQKGGGSDLLDPRRVMEVITFYPDSRFSWWQEKSKGLISIGMGDRRQPPISGTYSVSGDKITIQYRVFPNTIGRDFIKQADGSLFSVHDGHYWLRSKRVLEGLP